MTSTIDALHNILNGQPPVTPTRPASGSTPQPEDPIMLQEAAIRKEKYREQLKHGVWYVSFTKVDGTQTVMECTLDPRYLPPEDPQDIIAKVATNPTVLRVYAMDRSGWRSFKVLNVLSICQKPETL